MILSAGLTPAWQQILAIDRFRPGEVNRAREVLWCGSGKVLNAGVGLHSLGCASLTLSPLGGPARDAIKSEFRELGVPCRWIDTEAHTRICTTILDAASGAVTELVENGRSMTPEELDAFHSAYVEEAARADLVILIGSLPVGTPNSYYRKLLEKTPSRCLLDFRGEGLLSVLDLKPFVVKPNREELAQTLGSPIAEDRQLLAAMQELNRRGAAWVIVTQGPGPVWLTSTTQAYRFFPPAVDQVANPIGSGDALAAATAWAICDGCQIVESVRLGIAAACENLRQLLPCRLNPLRVQELARTVELEVIG